jgi:toxin ParE1/3/4
MGAYKLSRECEIDISEIYEYGIEKFGLKQAQEYVIGLHDLL